MEKHKYKERVKEFTEHIQKYPRAAPEDTLGGRQENHYVIGSPDVRRSHGGSRSPGIRGGDVTPERLG